MTSSVADYQEGRDLLRSTPTADKTLNKLHFITQIMEALTKSQKRCKANLY